MTEQSPSHALASRLIDGLSIAGASAAGVALLVAGYLSLARPIAIAPLVSTPVPTFVFPRRPRATAAHDAHDVAPRVRTAGGEPKIAHLRVAHVRVGHVRVAHVRVAHGSGNARIARSSIPNARNVTVPIGYAPSAPRAATRAGARTAARTLQPRRSVVAAAYRPLASPATARRPRRDKPHVAARALGIPEPPLGYDGRPSFVGAQTESTDARVLAASALAGLRVRGRAISMPLPSASVAP